MNQLVQLEKNLRGLGARDTVVIAISADSQEKVDKTIAKYALTFPVLSDTDLKVIKEVPCAPSD